CFDRQAFRCAVPDDTRPEMSFIVIGILAAIYFCIAVHGRGEGGRSEHCIDLSGLALEARRLDKLSWLKPILPEAPATCRLLGLILMVVGLVPVWICFFLASLEDNAFRHWFVSFFGHPDDWTFFRFGLFLLVLATSFQTIGFGWGLWRLPHHCAQVG